MGKDPTLKTVRELVYYFPDRRATAPTALVAEGFDVDAEVGDVFVAYPERDTIVKGKDGSTITIPKGYAFKTDRMITRKRRPDEPAPTAPVAGD